MSGKKPPQSSGGVLGELSRALGEERIAAAFGGVVETAASAKASVDHNIEAVLSLANLPSRHDIRNLDSKLEAIERTLINLSRKVDRLAKKRD